MMLKLLSLTGDHQGSQFKIFEGLVISSKTDSNIPISALNGSKLTVEVHQGGGFVLRSNEKIIMSADECVSEIDLIPGVSFAIQNEGFCVQDYNEEEDDVADFESKKSILTTLIESLKIKDEPKTPQTYFLEKNLSFHFVRGPLLKTSWKIPAAPMSFGLKSHLYFFIDSNIQIDEDFLSLKLDEGSLKLENSIPGFVTINGQTMNGSNEVTHGDLVEFGDTAFYIELK